MKAGIGTYTYGWAIGSLAYPMVNAMDERALVAEALEFGVFVLQTGDNLPLHLFETGRLRAFNELLQHSHLKLEVGARGLTYEHLEPI